MTPDEFKATFNPTSIVYIRVLASADQAPIRYDPVAYPIHGVPNNAIALHWLGLLADDDAAAGMVLTQAGRDTLAAWRATHPDDVQGVAPPPARLDAPRPRPIVDVHLPGTGPAKPAPDAAPVQDALFDA